MLRPPRRARFAIAAALFVVAGCSSDSASLSQPEPPLATARWSDAASWPGGIVPAAGADVTIPAGTAILLDVSPPPLGTLIVDGALEFDRRDLALVVERIEVAGTLRVGTESSPFMERATITLTGTTNDPALTLRNGIAGRRNTMPHRGHAARTGTAASARLPPCGQAMSADRADAQCRRRQRSIEYGPPPAT